MSRMKLLVCTWNVGNAAPPLNLKPWLGGDQEFDIVVVGAQEANFSADNDKNEGASEVLQSFKKNSLRTISSAAAKLSPRGRKSPSERSSFDWKRSNINTDSPNQMQSSTDRLSSCSQSSREEYTTQLVERLGLMQEKSEPRPSQSRHLSIRRSVSCDRLSASSSEYLEEARVESPPIIRKMPPVLDEETSIPDDSVRPLATPKTPSSAINRLKTKLSKVIKKPGVNKAGDMIEQNPSSPVSTQDTLNAKRFSKRVENALGNTYVLVAKHHLMEIKLLVFVHQRNRDRVMRTQTTAEATGLGSVVGNKGGVAVKLTIDDTSFCFVSSHLAAHEGAKFLKDRINDVIMIMRNIEKTRSIGLPAVHQFDHLVWLGDLNYRLDLERFLPESNGWGRERQWNFVCEQIQNGNYDKLFALDELSHEMKAGNVFGRFREGKITFAPTFKVVRNVDELRFQDTRIPSYCDRILWHSLPNHQNHIALKEYQPVPEIATSDHKPVYAIFNLFVPKPFKYYTMPAPSSAVKCTVDFHAITLMGLYEKEIDPEGAQFKFDVLDEHTEGTGEEPRTDTPQASDRKDRFARDTKTATKRTVRVEFYAADPLFAKQKPYRTEVPLRNGLVRSCKYDELPAIALVPLAGITELTFKYITIVFSRMGTKQGASCILPLAKLVQAFNNRTTVTLDLTKYGNTIAQAEIDVELVCSMHCWITSKNKIVKVRHRRR